MTAAVHVVHDEAATQAMFQMFEAPGINAENFLKFKSAGRLSPADFTMNAQAWANRVLNGAKLKAIYANVTLSGLLLIRDTHINLFSNKS